MRIGRAWFRQTLCVAAASLGLAVPPASGLKSPSPLCNNPARDFSSLHGIRKNVMMKCVCYSATLVMVSAMRTR